VRIRFSSAHESAIGAEVLSGVKRTWRGHHAMSSVDPSATLGRLFRLDDDFDCGVGPENLAVTGMMLSVPMSDTPLDLAEKI